MWIDTHAHLTAAPLLEHFDELLKRAKEAAVDSIINISTDQESLSQALLRSSEIFNAAACTPHELDEDFFSSVEKHARAGDLIAVGECGLDFYNAETSRDLQEDFFRRQIRLAKDVELPLIIHCREAFPELIKILDDEAFDAKLLLHCFTGTYAQAQELIERGYWISFSGILTFSKSEELRRIAASLPLDKILVETDAPYLSPVPYRGKLNEPSYLPSTGQCLANIHGISTEEMARISSANAARIFPILSQKA